MFDKVQNIMRSYTYRVVIVLCLPLQVLCLGLKLEGLIDLGPKWDYTYKLTPIKDNSNENKELSDKNNLNIIRTVKKVEEHDFVSETIETNKQDFHMIKQTSQENISEDSVSEDNDETKVGSADDRSNESDSEESAPREYTKPYASSANLSDDDGNPDLNVTKKIGKLTTTQGIVDKRNDVRKKTLGYVNDSILRLKIRANEQKIKDNSKIKEFTVHIMKQSLDIFDKMKKSTDDERIKRKLRSLRQSFMEKFGEFLKDISEYKLKTKLAKQNVILHTIDVNNYILKRIVNSLSDDKDHPDRLSGIVNVFKNEVEKVRNIENKHACMKLSICRSNGEYSDFIIEVISISLRCSHRKFQQLNNALIETVKNTNLSGILEVETVNKLYWLLDVAASWDPYEGRWMFIIIKNVVANKNRPITRMSDEYERYAINRTITMHSLIDILNKNMGTVENKNMWDDILYRMEGFKDGKRDDVQQTVEMLINQLVRVMGQTDIEVRKTVNELMFILLTFEL
ncbi:repetitive organellar protein-like [Vanessa cardui]|uniref:repetitive organellar protein-like n=1 Tax=Vanessa cardui TaxID=171605 RepID=UPI001F13D657|nr:repetitive organellar protein-like [Vanessa cardui]